MLEHFICLRYSLLKPTFRQQKFDNKSDHIILRDEQILTVMTFTWLRTFLITPTGKAEVGACQYMF